MMGLQAQACPGRGLDVFVCFRVFFVFVCLSLVRDAAFTGHGAPGTGRGGRTAPAFRSLGPPGPLGLRARVGAPSAPSASAAARAASFVSSVSSALAAVSAACGSRSLSWLSRSLSGDGEQAVETVKKPFPVLTIRPGPVVVSTAAPRNVFASGRFRQ